jgi:hypothetical protein
MDRKVFECLRCGSFTPFSVNARPRCGLCGCMTGIVDHDGETPRFRDVSNPIPRRLRSPSGQHEH